VPFASLEQTRNYIVDQGSIFNHTAQFMDTLANASRLTLQIGAARFRREAPPDNYRVVSAIL
jgi:hypothetical protein